MKIKYIIFCGLIVSHQTFGMHQLLPQLGFLKTLKITSPQHYVKRFVSSCNQACECYSSQVIERSILRQDTLERWRKFHAQAIRHRIDSAIDLNNIEQNEWIVTAQDGTTWKDYTKSAIIKFARKKLKHAISDDQRLYWTKWDVETEFRDNQSLTQDTQFFILEANQDSINFTSLKNIQDSFSMAINIDDKDLPIVKMNDSWKNIVEKIEHSVECLYHFELGIPHYIALKPLDKVAIQDLQHHRKLTWVSLSANGQNLLTKTTDGNCYLWSIEHID